MKKFIVLLFIILAAGSLFSQENDPAKYALVIGNGNYTGITRLNNPVNDANDMAAVLKSLGFDVDIVLNGRLDQMESAVLRLKNRLSVSRDAYGFLFYAGHGVQSNGENFLLPVDANIPSESFLRQRAVSVQAILDELNEAGNILNIFILDACRDNPFSWRRSGSRGLTMINNQPADSIIVYATSAGSTAADGTGRNGLFTSHLLDNLKIPGIEVSEVFRRTMGDVALASGNQQRPAVYNQFPGLAYLGDKPGESSALTASITPSPEYQAAEVRESVLRNNNSISPVSYGFMNMAFGLGSYLQGDKTSGYVITGGYALSIGLIAWELAGLKYDDPLAGIPGTVGLGLAGATLVYGFIMPHIFNNNSKFATITERVNISLVSDNQHKNIFQVTYKHSF